MQKWTRRGFLKGTLMIGAAAVIAACTPKGAPSEGEQGEPGEGTEANPFEDLASGEGKVMELDGQEVAVYKDEEGAVVKLSPVCPHAGCTVKWNATDRIWDCPCHQSHFEPDGTYIKGPANEGLKPIG